MAVQQRATTLGRVSQTVFSWRHRVTYAECTVGNHVYYSRYLDILEEARGEFFRHIGQPAARLQEAGVIFPVTEARVRYHKAARYDDVLTVELFLEELGRVRLVFACRVRDEHGQVLVEATTTHACTGLNDKLTRIPEPLRKALLK